jgi:hypothetical protein
MSGIINIEEHNKKVENLNSKISAIKEGATLGVETLQNNKPEPIKKISIRDNAIYPTCNSDRSYQLSSTVDIAGKRLDDFNRFGRRDVEVCPDDLLKFAACIIKAFGPIPQELIDSVEVK